LRNCFQYSGSPPSLQPPVGPVENGCLHGPRRGALFFMRKRTQRRKPKKAAGRGEPKRIIGFHCAYCRGNNPYNERFVPLYFRPPVGHGDFRLMCYSCWVELRKDPRGFNGAYRIPYPRLNSDTLAQFWEEDVSDGDPVEAAADFFRCAPRKILEVMNSIRIIDGPLGRFSRTL